MTTSEITLNDTTWTQITTGADFVVQNNGREAVLIKLSDATPATDTGAIVLNSLLGLDSTSFGGTVWGKTNLGLTASVSVTQ